jgi:hypothetical protein
MNNTNLWRRIGAVLLVSLVLAACGTRSISDSAYREDTGWRRAPNDNPLYKGELSEFQVLGIDPAAKISEEDIQKALATSQRITLPKGSGLMLVQSGALIPDSEMVKGLEAYFNVSAFSGVPLQGSASGDNYSKALRFAAAKSGAQKMVVYWGLLESGRQNLATKTVSWFPFVGGIVPDEAQLMRIHLKVAVVDVKTGQWDMFSPDAFDDKDISGDYTRASSDQAQVALLKTKAYAAAVKDLVKRYSK